MTLQEIVSKLKTIKGEHVNGNINSDELIECIEDVIHEIEGNDGLSWDSEHYEDFEQTDFSNLKY